MPNLVLLYLVLSVIVSVLFASLATFDFSNRVFAVVGILFLLGWIGLGITAYVSIFIQGNDLQLWCYTFGCG